MKNKKLLYILAPAAIIIWGLVILNIVRGLSSSDEYELPVYEELSFQDDSIASVGYELWLNYRDPFKTGYQPGPAETKKDEVRLVRNVNPREQRRQPVLRVNWPAVEYRGLVMNDNRTVALVQINNRNSLLTEGSKSQEVVLEKMYADSVVLTFNNEKKTFKLSTNR